MGKKDMKAVIMVQYVTDDADVLTIQDALMDAAISVCPEVNGTGECWCELGASHVLDCDDDEMVDWKVVKLDADI